MFIPLPAVIFLCSVILLLIALALLYFFLKKHECCKMEGKAGSSCCGIFHHLAMCCQNPGPHFYTLLRHFENSQRKTNEPVKLIIDACKTKSSSNDEETPPHTKNSVQTTDTIQPEPNEQIEINFEEDISFLDLPPNTPDEEEELIDGGDPSLKGASTNGQTNTNAENSSTTNNGPASGGEAGTINTQTGEAGSSSQQAGGGGGGGGGATGGGAGASGGGGGTAVDSAGNNNIQADPSGGGTDVAGKSNGISSASGNGMQGQSAKSMSNSNDINAQGEDMSIIVDEPVQGVDFIESEETEPLAIAGKVLVQFTYMPAANKVNLTLIRIGDMPPVERGGSETVQAHLCVLPMRKQRFRTKAVPVSKGVFNETFQFIHMTKDLVETCAIRLRIYGTQRFSKRLIGEVKMPLSKLDLTSPLADEQIWKNLSPKGLVAYWYGIDEEDEPDDDDW